MPDNPYLAHLHPSQRGVASGSNSVGPAVKEPLYGFLARKVNGDQVRKAIVRSPGLNTMDGR
jgi:pre-mRNA-splicing factor ATP-dependent RNA helicase DHX15/PRP43